MSDKYKNGKIYTIRYKHDDTLIYVGYTYACICVWIYMNICIHIGLNTPTLF